tara:strand:+ start:28704 stop:29039 length:336 start_codon:yes stop_codon:yes gene_type:complete
MTSETQDEDMVERVAKAAAYSIRQPNDVSRDADEYWDWTGGAAKHTWRVAIAAAITALPPQEVSVQEAARVVHADMQSLNGTDIWDKNLKDKPRGIVEAILRALSEKPHGQ